MFCLLSLRFCDNVFVRSSTYMYGYNKKGICFNVEKQFYYSYKTHTHTKIVGKTAIRRVSIYHLSR